MIVLSVQKEESYWENIEIHLEREFNYSHMLVQTGIFRAKEQVAAGSSLTNELPKPDPQRGSNQVPPWNDESGLITDIDSLRYKYLLGKLVGRDVTDVTGKVILRRNDTITREVVQLAEREGKLSELIVNMTVPGLEEDHD